MRGRRQVFESWRALCESLVIISTEIGIRELSMTSHQSNLDRKSSHLQRFQNLSWIPTNTRKRSLPQSLKSLKLRPKKTSSEVKSLNQSLRQLDNPKHLCLLSRLWLPILNLNISSPCLLKQIRCRLDCLLYHLFLYHSSNLKTKHLQYLRCLIRPWINFQWVSNNQWWCNNSFLLRLDREDYHHYLTIHRRCSLEWLILHISWIMVDINPQDLSLGRDSFHKWIWVGLICSTSKWCLNR